MMIIMMMIPCRRCRRVRARRCEAGDQRRWSRKEYSADWGKPCAACKCPQLTSATTTTLNSHIRWKRHNSKNWRKKSKPAQTKLWQTVAPERIESVGEAGTRPEPRAGIFFGRAPPLCWLYEYN